MTVEVQVIVYFADNDKVPYLERQLNSQKPHIQFVCGQSEVDQTCQHPLMGKRW